MFEEEAHKPTKPFLKWAGNKFRIIGEVLETIRDQKKVRPIERYIEPFGGSGAVIANLGRDFSSRTYGEFNPELTDLMTVLTENTNALVKETEKLFEKKNNDSVEYYKLRTEFNQLIGCETADRIRKSALFIYLNRHCFNGLCRYGPSGFNVPFGRYSKTIAPSDEILAFAEKMKGVKIAKPCSFEKLMVNVGEDTLIYCDPPYYPLTQTSKFTQYSSKAGFDDGRQEELARKAAECASKGAIVLISNHYVDKCLETYSKAANEAGVKVRLDHTIPVARFISSKGTDRGNKVVELIAAFYAE